MGETIVAPNVRGSEFIELSATTKKPVRGRLFRKQILHEGSFIHPNNPSKRVVVDRKFAEALVNNFNEGACDIVQVPIVDDKNHHSEDPTRNIGEVVGLSYEPGVGVFADIDARRHADDLGDTIIGASAMISMSYRNNLTGEVKSPVLLHVAGTNRPFITNLSGFQEVLSMSDTSTDGDDIVILSEDKGGTAMSKDELIAALRDYGVDVADLQRRAAAVDDFAALSNIIDTEDANLTLSEVAQATVELDEQRTELQNQVASITAQCEELQKERDTLRMSAAETEVDSLISEGRILPKSRDKMIELSVRDRDLFDSLVPDEPIISLSAGQTHTTYENGADEAAVDEEVDRLLNKVK